MRKKRLNRILGIILAIMLPLAIVGGIVTVTMMFNQNSFTRVANTYNATTIEKEFENVEAITIKDIVDTVEVVATDSDKVNITYNGFQTVEANLSGKELTVKNEREIFWGFSGAKWWNLSDWFNVNDSEGQLKIEVPKNVKTLEIKSSVGNMTVDKLQLEDITINGGVGTFTLNDLEVTKTFDVTAGVGDIEVNRLSGSPIVQADAGVGNLDFFTATIKSMEIKGGLGNVELREIKADNIDIEGGVGNIRIEDSIITSLSGNRGLGNVSINNSDIRNNSFGFGGSDIKDKIKEEIKDKL